jgi:hypothetical protein
MRVILLATTAVLLCGANSYLYGGADRPKEPPDIYLTCQVERVIQGDGRLLTDFAEQPFSFEIWTKEGVISWREDYNARAQISRTTIEFQYSASAEQSGPHYHHEAYGTIDRLTGYYQINGSLYPTTDPGEVETGHCKPVQPKF